MSKTFYFVRHSSFFQPGTNTGPKLPYVAGGNPGRFEAYRAEWERLYGPKPTLAAAKAAAAELSAMFPAHSYHVHSARCLGLYAPPAPRWVPA